MLRGSWCENRGRYISLSFASVCVSAIPQQRAGGYASVRVCVAAWQLCKHCLGIKALFVWPVNETEQPGRVQRSARHA